MAAAAAAFAGKGIATSVISYIINKAFDYLKDNKKDAGLKSTKKRLLELVPQIQVIFDAVDTDQIRDQSEALDAWLWQLRDAVEEAEDALDELEYYKLEEEVKMRDNKVSGSFHKFKGRFVQQFNHAFNTGSLKRLKSAVGTLDDAVSGVERFLHVLNQFDNKKMKNHRQAVDSRNQRETSSLPPSMVLGREEERKVLVDWLTKAENSAPEQIVNNVPIFSIVGIGGLGKTTLAQVICNDNEVIKCFDFIIWTSVSFDFDVERLIRKILQDITGEEINIVGLNLNALHKALKEKLSSKTFLLVLDDVWNDQRVDYWDNLVRPLRYGKKGSKILMTTRMQSVADLAARAMQVDGQSLRLSGLEEADLLVLLNSHAFFGVNPDDYRNLQQISKKMAGKLCGSPLSAKVLGGLLNSKRDSSTWNKILASSIYIIPQGKEGIMTVLRLSYHHLQTHLQACFRYCSLFHKDYEFTKKELVYLWMGSGLIQHVGGGMMPEEVGMEYLDTLTMKSFFDIKLRPRSHRAIKCNLFDEYYEEKYVIHDLLHELAHSASVNECIRVERNFSGIIPKTVRHMCIELTSPTVVEQISQVKKLRTLIMHFQDQDEEDQELIVGKVLSVATSLRVLSLITNSTCKLPKTVNAMVHLRYLSLIWGRKNMTHFSWFPPSVYKLYHLEMMKFDSPQFAVPVKGEMEGVCNLVNLRHLQLSYGIMPMIPYVGKLTSLCELYDFQIQQQSGYTIGELKNLKNICHLHVSGLDKVNSAEEAAEVMLDQKEKLSAVTFSWSPRPEDLLKLGSSSSDSCDPSKAEQILDKLQPHPNSCKLKIQGYPGSRSPCWLESLELINLTFLCLCDCKVLQRLPPIGQLPSLQYLYISNMESVDRVDSSFYGSDKPHGLRSLKVLEIEDMPRCTEWVGLDDENLFPRLDTLVVRNCKELRHVPIVPISIQHVEIHCAGLRALPPLFVTSDTSSSSSPALSLSKLVISHCPDLATLWQGCSFPALEELSIKQCVSLSCLPEDSLCSLSNLKTFEILKCPNLMTGEIRLPPTVRSFTLGSCSSAESLLFKSLLGLISLKRLYLDGCAMLSLPSDVFACLTGLTDIMFIGCAMTSFPSAEAFAGLTSLENLAIWDCKDLASLDGIQGLPSLTLLQISGCDRLVEDMSVQSAESADLSGCTLELCELDIDHSSLLLKEPLRSITTVKRLRISGGPELKLLPEEWLLRNCQALEEVVVDNASDLQCLPQEMASLTSLQSLQISHANLIQTLPDMPASLNNLRIHNCHSNLKKLCKKNVGPDWGKVEHIHNVDIS
ncbi:hypothetical protein SETIT_1G166800v2 [Setaria italica]|uniref:NB-ARC domain-containing protein n=1 Tax=Setaria italica TaxID=4555 RepID=K3YZT3_SETIT|nr:disease resistance protein RGA2 [Setaria italica]RCV06490.1 hypothetical protein SETIT_1G166800v2 [Setaria italica]